MTMYCGYICKLVICPIQHGVVILETLFLANLFKQSAGFSIQGGPKTGPQTHVLD